jgi:hypothetical protein
MDKIGRRKGFTLLSTVIIFGILSLLGATTLRILMAEYNFTNIDSISKSAYYIAESGVNIVINDINKEIKAFNENPLSYDTFFNKFESDFLNKNIILDDFTENSGEKPIAIVKISKINADNKSREYKIESIGYIGKIERKVTSTINLNLSEVIEEQPIDNLLFYTKKLVFQGNSLIGNKGVTVSDSIETHNLNGGSKLKITTMYFNGPVSIDGGSAEFGNSTYPGTIYVNGDLNLWNGTRDVYGTVRVNGNFRLKDASIHGDVYVNGDVELGWTPKIDNNIFYTGELKHPANYKNDLLSKCKKVDSVDNWTVPTREVTLRDNAWYVNNGYTIQTVKYQKTLPDNSKFLVDDYKFEAYPEWNINDGDLLNIVLVSKKDIVINTGKKFTGALIAPNGSVTLTQGGTNFEGIIISKDGIVVSGGGSNVTVVTIDQIFSKDSIPVKFLISGNTGGNSNNMHIEVTVKEGVRED